MWIPFFFCFLYLSKGILVWCCWLFRIIIEFTFLIRFILFGFVSFICCDEMEFNFDWLAKQWGNFCRHDFQLSDLVPGQCYFPCHHHLKEIDRNEKEKNHLKINQQFGFIVALQQNEINSVRYKSIIEICRSFQCIIRCIKHWLINQFIMYTYSGWHFGYTFKFLYQNFVNRKQIQFHFKMC